MTTAGFNGTRLQVLLLLATIVATLGKQDSCYPTALDMTAQWFTMVPQVGHMVETLDLSDNNLTIIMTNAFHTYPNLKDLRLSHNTIYKIEAGAFSELPSLVYVDLSSNNLTHIHPCTFYFNYNLERLYLQHNSLWHVVAGTSILVSKSLQFLNLRYSSLTDLRVDNFEDLPSLEHLYLSYNTSERPKAVSMFTDNLQRTHGCALTIIWESELDGTILHSVCWPRGGSKHFTTVHCSNRKGLSSDKAEKPVEVPTEPTAEDSNFINSVKGLFTDKPDKSFEVPSEPLATDGVNLIIPIGVGLVVGVFIGILISIGSFYCYKFFLHKHVKENDRLLQDDLNTNTTNRISTK